MKNLAILLIVSCFCFTGCKNSSSRSSWFQHGQDKYVILVRGYVDANSAHREALSKATNLAKQKGYRYFSVLKSSDVDVIGNQMVVEKTFANENVKKGFFAKKEVSSGYQILVRLYKKKPFFAKVIDTCRYGRCLKLRD